MTNTRIMSSCNDLRLYLRTMYVLGLLCASYDPLANSLYATETDERRACIYFVVIEFISFTILTYSFCKPEQFHMLIYNRTGNIYSVMYFRCCCLSLCILYTCFYLRRQRFKRFLQLVLHVNRNCLVNRYAFRYQQNYSLFVVMFVLCEANYLHGYWFAHVPTLTLVLYLLVYGYCFLVMGFVLVLCDCLKQIIAAGLAYYNRQTCAVLRNIEAPAKRAIKLRACFSERQNLLALCFDELNDFFGLLLLPTMVVILIISPAGPFYLISTVFEFAFTSHLRFVFLCCTAIFWDVPWLTMVLIMLRNDDIAKEANKTVKILSKMPRTGSGLDRMVEKFLLKNVRRQPILTAYGFFSLDKSTLFKLFTTIFTYMVILVQFKEMESTTKHLQPKKT